MRHLILLFLLIAPQAKADPWILNFSQVEEGIFRGAMPNTYAMAHLKDLGVKTVINLVSLPTQIALEDLYARQNGIKVINISMHGWRAPSDVQVDEAIAALANPANRPVFIHCEHGKDRTGLVVGLYRIEHSGWPVEQAFDEMKANGFSIAQVLIKKYFKRRAGFED